MDGTFLRWSLRARNVFRNHPLGYSLECFLLLLNLWDSQQGSDIWIHPGLRQRGIHKGQRRRKRRKRRRRGGRRGRGGRGRGGRRNWIVAPVIVPSNFLCVQGLSFCGCDGKLLIETDASIPKNVKPNVKPNNLFSEVFATKATC